jgi:hypothetical protein
VCLADVDSDLEKRVRGQSEGRGKMRSEDRRGGRETAEIKETHPFLHNHLLSLVIYSEDIDRQQRIPVLFSVVEVLPDLLSSFWWDRVYATCESERGKNNTRTAGTDVEEEKSVST